VVTKEAPAPGWEIEKEEEEEERDRRKSGGADADVANRERAAEAVIFMSGASPRGGPRLLVYIVRTLDGGLFKGD